jgi:hypothetical protein
LLLSFHLIYLSTVFCQTDTTRYHFVDEVQGIPVTYIRPEIEAHYPYGPDSLTSFLRENLPVEMHRHFMANWYVVLQFIVRQDSTLTNFKFVSGNKNLFEYATKAIKLTGPWIPGIDKSKSVQSFVKLKVKFPQPG